MTRKNPRPPRSWSLPSRPGGTALAGSQDSTVGRPKKGKAAKALAKKTRDPLQKWLETKLPLIMPKIPAVGGGHLSMEDWTGTKLGEGSFGLVFLLRDGRVFKLGFDYSEAWFLNNLNVLFPDDTDEALNALPRIDYFEDISRFSGWEPYIMSGALDDDAGPQFHGPNRDASAFVMVREDVASLDDGLMGRPAEKVLGHVFDMSARRVRTSVESREGAMSDADGPTVSPDLREGLYALEEFEINGHPKKVGYREDAEGWAAVEAAQELLGPIVRMVRELANTWEVYLPDARAANFGRAADGKIVLRDLGWVYAPQYSEWNVSGPISLSALDEDEEE